MGYGVQHHILLRASEQKEHRKGKCIPDRYIRGNGKARRQWREVRLSNDLLTAPYLGSIEGLLESQVPGRWRRITQEELGRLVGEGWYLGWDIALREGDVLCPGVDHLIVVVDRTFPNSQPRVLAPQGDKDYSWPHIEPKGLLCLRATMNEVDPGHRILQHLVWAQELLSLPAVERQQEFHNEFLAYWSRRASTAGRKIVVLSLLNPSAGTREITYVDDWKANKIIVSDDLKTLMQWLRNSGYEPREKDLAKTWLIWLDHPWTPAEFPETGSAVLRHIPRISMDKLLIPGSRIPLVFGASTLTGTVFVATILEGQSEKFLQKGFRNSSSAHFARIRDSFSTHSIQRFPVTRVDTSWVHGRDHDQSALWLSNKRVGIIGCGAIGSSVARLLAQSGVGHFLLVDSDTLDSPNTARHALGISFVGQNKARALSQALKRDFPHISEIESYPVRFENLKPIELKKLADLDVFVTAGLDIDGDMAVNTWRRKLARSPAHVCAWTEPFALAGHAVALFGDDSLMVGFDNEERFIFRLTDWPEPSLAMVVEAGCGNLFQPHGAVDLHAIVGVTASLAMDILLEKLNASCRRVWMGDQSRVLPLGGVVLPAFTDNQCIKEYTWT